MARPINRRLFLSEVMDLIGATRKQDEKKQLLRIHDSKFLRALMTYAFDPRYELYGNGHVPPNKGADQAAIGLNPNTMFHVLRSLYVCTKNYKLAGSRKEAILIQFLESLGREENALLQKLMRRTLRYGLSARLVNEVFPGLIYIPPKKTPIPLQKKVEEVSDMTPLPQPLPGTETTPTNTPVKKKKKTTKKKKGSTKNGKQTIQHPTTDSD